MYIHRVLVEVILQNESPPETALSIVKGRLQGPDIPVVTGLKVQGVRSNYALNAPPLPHLISAGLDGRDWHRKWQEECRLANELAAVEAGDILKPGM